MSSPFVGYLLKPITPTNLAEQIAVVVVCIVLPILIILFLHCDKGVRDFVNKTPTAYKKCISGIQMPSPKSFLLNLLVIVVLLIIGAIPVIFWTIIMLMLTSANPACGNLHLVNIVGILYYCIIRR
jgi:hypothetical protein